MLHVLRLRICFYVDGRLSAWLARAAWVAYIRPVGDAVSSLEVGLAARAALLGYGGVLVVAEELRDGREALAHPGWPACLAWAQRPGRGDGQR